MASENTPLVTIVTATYHRPAVLAHAIRAVLTQTFENWELLVVGDCCTDATEATVRSFNDPRIRFINLVENCGEQSGPNNAGLRQARGEFIAFVNHDDIWFPDHLSRSLDVLQETGADFVYSLGLGVEPDGSLRLLGYGEGDRYEPSAFAGASSWVFRRALIERVGYWRNYRECFLVPSQDWLFRAYRSGADMRRQHEINWLAIMSGIRKGSYAEPHRADEHAHWFARMAREPDLRDKAAARLVPEMRARLDAHAPRHPIRALRRAVNRALFRVGLSSMMLRNILRHGGRGGYITRLLAVRGLPPK